MPAGRGRAWPLLRPLLLCFLAVEAHLLIAQPPVGHSCALSTSAVVPAAQRRQNQARLFTAQRAAAARRCPLRTSAVVALAAPSQQNPRHLTSLLTRAADAEAVLQLHAKHGESFNEINLATCWSALARVSSAAQQLQWQDDASDLAALRLQTASQPSWLDARSISSTVHSLAKLGLYGAEWDGLWSQLCTVAAGRTSAFGPQGLVMTAWAFARRGQPASALFDAIAAEATPRLGEYKPQELANTAWAFASSGHAAPALFDGISASARAQLPSFKPRELSSMAWSFARAGHEAPALFDAISVASSARLSTYSAQSLANLAWAFAKLGHPSASLFQAVALASVPRLAEFKPQELANLVWAYAKAEYEESLFFSHLDYMCRVRLAEFKPQELAGLAWAFSKRQVRLRGGERARGKEEVIREQSVRMAGMRVGWRRARHWRRVARASQDRLHARVGEEGHEPSPRLPPVMARRWGRSCESVPPHPAPHRLAALAARLAPAQPLRCHATSSTPLWRSPPRAAPAPSSRRRSPRRRGRTHTPATLRQFCLLIWPTPPCPGWASSSRRAWP